MPDNPASSVNNLIAAGVQAPNPLAVMGQYAQTGNALLNFQQGQQQIAARQAIGQAYQQAYDPNTQSTDYTKLLGLVEQDPRAAWMAPQIAQGIQQQQLRQYQLNSAGLKQTSDRTGAINSALGALVRKGTDIQPGDIYRTVAGLGASGFPTDEFVHDMAATMPVLPPDQANNPGARAAYSQQLQSWVLNHAARSWSPDTVASTFSPHVTTVDNGGRIVPTDMNAYTNPGITSTAIPKQLTPSEQVAQVRASPDPVTGAPRVQPNAAFAASQGLGGLVPSSSASPLGNGRYGAAPSQSGPMPTGFGPQQQAGLTAAGSNSAQQWGDAMKSVGGSATRQFILDQALHSLQNAPTGPGSDKANYYASMFQTMAPGMAKAFGIDPNEVASYDKANKYLTQYASQQAAAHGAGTDQQLATTLSGNASTKISNLAAQDVVKANLALEKMGQAQMESFQNGIDPATGQVSATRMTPDQYADYAAKWNRSTDPRAFLADQLNPQQFQDAAKAGGQKFRNTFNLAVRNGWIGTPAWMAKTPQMASPGAAAPAVMPGGAGRGY